MKFFLRIPVGGGWNHHILLRVTVREIPYVVCRVLYNTHVDPPYQPFLSSRVPFPP